MSSIDNSSELEIPQGLKFEDAVVKLNQIVERMESTDVDLDKMIENYQSGLSLLKCTSSIIFDKPYIPLFPNLLIFSIISVSSNK